MWNKFKNFFDEGFAELEWEWKKSSTKKLLVYDDSDNLIGTLSYKNKFFIFQYDSKATEKISGLEDFNEEILPSFFSSRIPHPYRANILNEFKKYKDDPIELLGNLGAYSPISKYKFEIDQS